MGDWQSWVFYDKIRQRPNFGTVEETIAEFANTELQLDFVPEGKEYMLIHILCRERDLDALRILHNRFVGRPGFVGNERSVIKGLTPLHCLFERNDAPPSQELVRFVVENFPGIDPRAKLPRKEGDPQSKPQWTPLQYAMMYGFVDAVKYLLAQTRFQFELRDFAFNSWHAPELLDLRDEYVKDLAKTRHRLRRELNYERDQEEKASLVLALITSNETPSEQATRFFAITRRLPIELKMLISNYSQGINKQFVSEGYLINDLAMLESEK